MIELPNLAGIATQDLVEKIGGSNFSASYINWSRTMNLLRTHAPGWLPKLYPATEEGGIVHKAPIGGYLLIGFRHTDMHHTEPVPQAIMDHKNNAIPYDKITARDITDTHRRGVCMAAAFTFGLAYELWAKLPLESGYAEGETPVEQVKQIAGKPQDGCQMQDFPADRQAEISAWSNDIAKAFAAGDTALACKLWKDCDLPHEEKAASWFELDSHTRTSMTKFLKRAA